MSRRLGCASLILLAFGTVSACGGGEMPVDASSDAPPIDAAPACRMDGECDDGLVCNGTEHCTSGHCVAGTPLRCDDAIACTTDSCSEEMRRCLSRVPDVDGDGFGAATCLDTTGTPLGNDCDDADANRYPSNREVCDAAMHDEDCDASTHGGVDSDMDGFEDARCCNDSHCGDDCDDAHPSAHPGATEVCNLVDDDCDTMIDETVATTGFVDADRDGFGDPTMPLSACTTRAGFAADGTDCDDTNAARNPAQPEFCDSVDNDCDTTIDESAGAVTWYADNDGDGFGSASSGTTSACVPPAGYALRGSDCNDAVAGINPASAELCNGIDDDCNGTADYAIAPGDLEDDDHDGLADAHCPAPNGVDCDDRDASSGPGAVESCDGRDNDCDGRIDEGAAEVAFYRDVDGDGFGDSSNVRVGCTQPTGFVRRAGDCDDATAARAPGHAEACNAVDDDCDGATDEGEASASCAMVGSTMACVGGTCTTLGCTSGYGDCSASVVGCETDVRADPDHCGSCAACATPLSECSAGTCGPALGSLSAVEADVGDVVVERVLAVPSSTDVIVLGRFTGTLTLGATALVSLGGYDGFAARMRVDGSSMWAARWGGAGFDSMYAAAMTPDGSAFVVGGAMCDAILCGGPLTGCYGFWQRFGSVSAPGCAYASGMAATDAVIRGLAIEQSGGQIYVYATGSWTGTSSLGVGTAMSYDGFVLRARERAGMQPLIEWTSVFTGNFDELPLDMALDGASNLVVVGTTSSSADFGHGATGHAGFFDAFVANLDRSTGAVGLAAQFGTNTGDDHVRRVLPLPSGEVVIAGDFSGARPFGIGGPIVTGMGPENVFVFRLAASTLTARWGVMFDGQGDVGGLGLAGNDILVSGQLVGTLGLDRGTLVASGQAAFLAALDGSSGATRFARATTGGASDRSGGAVTRSDGQIAWEIEHDGFVGLGSSSLSSGTDQDMSMALVTP